MSHPSPEDQPAAAPDAPRTLLAGGLAFETGSLPVPHGFSPRAGGVSEGPYASLNLGWSVGDDSAAVLENRRRLAAAFGLELDRVARMDQVHGTQVRVAGSDHAGQDGDAIVGDDPGWLLVVSAADCLPLLLLDRRRGAVAAAHAGWRGTVGGVVPAVLEAMATRFGSDLGDLSAWLGPSIRGRNYQVGPEVVEAAVRAGAPEEAIWADPSVAGRWRLDVATVVRHQLQDAGVAPGAVEVSPTCTFEAAERCFSHRRDRGLTGRHWAVIRAAS